MISYHSDIHPAQAMGGYVSMLVVKIALLLELGLLVLDGEFRTSGGLPLLADEVRDLLVLGLLDGGFVVLMEKSQSFDTKAKNTGIYT